VVEVLRSEAGLTPALVPHAIQLLAWDPVAPDAVFALRKVAAARVGELIDSLIDPEEEFAVRRRLARVFSVCTSQRAADGLLLGLDDLRFEVRYQCGRSLSAMHRKNPALVFDSERIFAVVMRETDVGRPVWERRRLLDEVEAMEDEPFVGESAEQGRPEPGARSRCSRWCCRPSPQIAFRSLHRRSATAGRRSVPEGVLPADCDRQRIEFKVQRAAESPGRPDGPITNHAEPRGN
jgi:hypothetical protein